MEPELKPSANPLEPSSEITVVRLKGEDGKCFFCASQPDSVYWFVDREFRVEIETCSPHLWFIQMGQFGRDRLFLQYDREMHSHRFD